MIVSLPAPPLTVSLPHRAIDRVVAGRAVQRIVGCGGPRKQRSGGRQGEVVDVDGGITDTVDLDRADRRQTGIPDGKQGGPANRALGYPRGKVGRGNAETADIMRSSSAGVPPSASKLAIVSLPKLAAL